MNAERSTGVFNQLFSVFLAGLHVIMNVKHVTPCLAQRRCPVNMSLVFHLLFHNFMWAYVYVCMCVCVCVCVCVCIGFPGGSVGEEPSCNAGDSGSVPGLGRSPGGEHGSPLQCSCLENSMDRGTWWAIVHRITKSWTRLNQLSIHECTHAYTHTHRDIADCFRRDLSSTIRETPEIMSLSPQKYVYSVEEVGTTDKQREHP